MKKKSEEIFRNLKTAFKNILIILMFLYLQILLLSIIYIFNGILDYSIYLNLKETLNETEINNFFEKHQKIVNSLILETICFRESNLNEILTKSEISHLKDVAKILRKIFYNIIAIIIISILLFQKEKIRNKIFKRTNRRKIRKHFVYFFLIILLIIVATLFTWQHSFHLFHLIFFKENFSFSESSTLIKLYYVNGNYFLFVFVISFVLYFLINIIVIKVFETLQ